MHVPIDPSALIDASTDIESARSMPLHIALLVDPDSTTALLDVVTRAFLPQSSQARVDVFAWDDPAAISPEYDMAVIIAGTGLRTGVLAQALISVGVPALTVTDMPALVREIAEAVGCPLLESDVVSPDPQVDGDAFPETDEFNLEPYPFTVDRERTMLLGMGEWIVSTFRVKRLAFALSFPFVRRPLSLEAVHATSIQNAGIGLAFIIPGADMPLMTLNQAKMVLQIAAAYGEPLGRDRWRELAVLLGGAFASRSVARSLIGSFPVLGWAIRAGVGAGATEVMGHAAIAYFEGLSDGIYELPDEAGTLAHMREVAAAAQAKVQPYAQAIGSVAVSAAGKAATTVAEGARVVAPVVRDVALNVVVPAASHAVDKAAPVVRKSVDVVAPAVGHAVCEVVPAVRETVLVFCRKQGIEPDEFARQMANSFIDSRGGKR